MTRRGQNTNLASETLVCTRNATLVPRSHPINTVLFDKPGDYGEYEDCLIDGGLSCISGVTDRESDHDALLVCE